LLVIYIIVSMMHGHTNIILNLCYQVKLWNLTIIRQPTNYQCKHYGPRWTGCVSIFKCGYIALTVITFQNCENTLHTKLTMASVSAQ